MALTPKMIAAALLEALSCDATLSEALAGKLGMDEMDAPVDRESVCELDTRYPGAGQGVAFDVQLEDGTRATVELSVQVRS